METPASGGLPESPTGEPKEVQESEGGLSKPLSPFTSQPAAEDRDLSRNEGQESAGPMSDKKSDVEDAGSNAPMDTAGMCHLLRLT